MGLVVIIIPRAFGERDSTITRTRLNNLVLALQRLKNPRVLGLYPSAAVERLKGPKGEDIGKTLGAGNDINRGIEALFVALHLPNVQVPLDNIDEDSYQNTDGDTMPNNPTVSSSPMLYEIVDAWGNPFVYFSAGEYKNPKDYSKYQLGGEEEGTGGDIVVVKPWKSEKTGRFLNADSFQLFSAGPDRIYNTDDDIGNWQ
jgi:hypothetical protein